MMITFTKVTLRALWHMWTAQIKMNVRKDTLETKASISRKLDDIKKPATGLNRQTGDLIEVPETGSGHENFRWPDAAMLDFDRTEGLILKVMHEKVMESDEQNVQYPNEIAAGVYNLDCIIKQICAEIKDKKE